MITYLKGSLFDAPKPGILVHACNAQGVWGSGIAKEFKVRFPLSFKHYHHMVIEHGYGYDRPGRAILCAPENGHQVACLVTSFDYGDNKDDPPTILKSTALALRELECLTHGLFPRFYSNKFNSGLFAVPWEDTVKVLNMVMDDTEWTVYEA